MNKRSEDELSAQLLRLPASGVLTLTLASHITLELARVPAGEFTMGSDKQKDRYARNNEFQNELPQHKVYVEEYWIGKYPVTNTQYGAFVKTTGHRKPGHWKGEPYPTEKGQHPVVWVSRRDAQAFCNWASDVTGVPLRLPSEAEWEKAARGTDGRIWPWGNQKPDRTRCNFESSGTTAVGKHSPKGDSPYGCADMAGNVEEFTSSLMKNYPYQSADGREDPDTPDPGTPGVRVVRGSGFSSTLRETRCAYRSMGSAITGVVVTGFRVCASPIHP